MSRSVKPLVGSAPHFVCPSIFLSNSSSLRTPISDPSGYEHLLSYPKTQIIYDATVVANILICLIHQANYLLDRQLRRLEADFLKEGGLRERMTRARLVARSRQT